MEDKENPTVQEVLAAHNMRRILDTYRTLAPLTIGGPASTSLEANQSNPMARLEGLKRLPQLQWILGSNRRRHSSSGAGNGSPGQPPALQPLHPPILSSRDNDSSRSHRALNQNVNL